MEVRQGFGGEARTWRQGPYIRMGKGFIKEARMDSLGEDGEIWYNGKANV